MSIADHQATLLFSSLDQPRAGKSNPNKVEYYATIALPPTAAADLADQMKAVTANGNLSGLRLTIEANSKKAKPHEGIPGDWLILRLASGPDYPPDLYTQTGQKIGALPVNGSEIRSEFFAGQRVRINGYPYLWNHAASGARGISWNLSGVMAVGGGERRGGGSGEPSDSVFAKYRGDEPAQQAPAQHAAQRGTEARTEARDSDPFRQTAPASSNPFGAAGGSVDDDSPF